VQARVGRGSPRVHRFAGAGARGVRAHSPRGAAGGGGGGVAVLAPCADGAGPASRADSDSGELGGAVAGGGGGSQPAGIVDEGGCEILAAVGGGLWREGVSGEAQAVAGQGADQARSLACVVAGCEGPAFARAETGGGAGATASGTPGDPGGVR